MVFYAVDKMALKTCFIDGYLIVLLAACDRRIVQHRIPVFTSKTLLAGRLMIGFCIDSFKSLFNLYVRPYGSQRFSILL